MTDLAALAITAHTDNQARRTEESKAYDAQQLTDILVDATNKAVSILGDAALSLAFVPIYAGQASASAAVADLPGRPAFSIRCLFTEADETGRLYLDRRCEHCGHTAVDEIRSLPHLGELLNDSPTA